MNLLLSFFMIVLAVACGVNKSTGDQATPERVHSVAEREAAVGFYEITNEKLRKSGFSFMVISSDHSVYILRDTDNRRYERSTAQI